MAGKFQIIARESEGNVRFWVGRKINPDLPLDEDNVEWKLRDGRPVKFDRYADAEAVVNGKAG